MDILKNPWVIGGVGVLLAVILLSRGSGGSGAAATSATTAASANATNVQLAGLTTNQNIASLQAQTAQLATAEGFLAHLDNNATVLDLAHQSVISGIVSSRISSQTVLQLDAQNNANRLALAPFQTDTAKALATTSANEAQSIAAIEASSAQAIAGINASATVQRQQAASSGGGTGAVADASSAVSTAASLLPLAAAFF